MANPGRNVFMTDEIASEIAPLTGELKPVRTAFFFQRLAPVALVILVATTGAVIATVFVEPEQVATWHVALGGAALLVLWLVTAGAWTSVAYSKERYEFFDHVIVAHRGSLVSDQTSELTIRNITHVKRRLPWPRYPLFGVGDVMIESAGSDASEITLRTIRRPDQVYAGVAALMRANGFQLAHDELIHEEQPDKLAVIIECAGMMLAVVVAILATVGEFFFRQEDDSSIGLYLSLLPLLGIVAIIFHYLDMRRRTYRVYADAVVYEEGFLTRDDAFIPGENIADSSTRRGLLDLILGLYDVQISCQGSQGEISFRRLRRGASLSHAVERVVAGGSNFSPAVLTAESVDAPLTGDESVDSQAVTATPRRVESTRETSPSETAAQESWTTELRPSPLRWVAPYLFLIVVAFPLAPVWIAAVVRGLIAALCTRYNIRANSVQERFQFLHSRERDFSYDKVTGAVIRENPLDRLFGTVTVSIWSIGSAQPLNLTHVDRKKLEMRALLHQLKIPEPDPIEEVPSRFSLPRMILASLPLHALLGLVVAGVLVFGAVVDLWGLLALLPLAVVMGGVIAHRRIYYPRCSVTVHRGHLECREGWLWRQHFFARYDNIKRVEITRYPRTDVGTVRFVVAGEHRPGSSSYATRKKQNKSQAALGAQSYGFQVRYAEQISRHLWAIDERIRGVEPQPQAAEMPLEHESGPALANSLATLILLSVLMLPLTLLLPITVPWTVLAVRRRRYLVEPHRVLKRSGILYRSQTSILHDRIDSLRRDQHLPGKLFGNGNVTIFTAGSSRPDLVLANARDYRELYACLQQHYTA